MKKAEVKGTIVSNDDKWIYDWFGITATCPNDLKEVLEKAGDDEVVVEINSGGGDVGAGSEMYYMLTQYQGNTVADVVGFCGSAATIICCGSRKARAVLSAQYMIHNVSTRAEGDYNVMDHTSGVLRNANDALAAVYQKKTGMSREELTSMMNKETWLTAEKAKEYGFIDEIIEPKTLYGSAFVTLLSDEVKDRIRNLVGNPNMKNGSDFLSAKLKIQRLRGEQK